MKVVVAGNPPEMYCAENFFIDRLRAEFPDISFQSAGTREEQVREIRDADVYSGGITREVFLAAERLRWVHLPQTGVDRQTGIPELVESDVAVTNCRGPHANPMADHFIGVMVTLTHLLDEMRDDQRAHRWAPQRYLGRQVELSGKTMGILAVGDLGMAIARRAHGFGMHVYAVDKNTEPRTPYVKEVWGTDRLDDLLQISDWFVVTAPLTHETRGLIDGRRLGLLKRGSYLLVVSRGHIVDEDALMEALKSGGLAGAGIDAFAEEPLPSDSPLWDAPNLIISPHASGTTPQIAEGRREIFVENLRRFLAGEPFLNVPDLRAGY